MTALHEYQRLEAAGLWRDGANAQSREVIIGLRDATIVLTDPKTDMPLTQWSLPAMVRLGEEAGFVTYASADDGLETIELDDPAMIAAFDKLRRVLDRRRRRPGRLRGALMAGAASAVIAVAVIWVPLRLNSFTAERLPSAARSAIADMTLADIQKTTGSPCTSRMGQIAAQNLARRIAPNNPPRIMIMRTGLGEPRALADGTILLPEAMVAAAVDPDALAGLVLAARTRAQIQDPMQEILQHAGFLATLRLLSSGGLPRGALDGFGLSLNSASPLDPDLFRRAFEASNISAQAYLDAYPAPELANMADPVPTGSDPLALTDADYLGLQYICGT